MYICAKCGINFLDDLNRDSNTEWSFYSKRHSLDKEYPLCGICTKEFKNISKPIILRYDQIARNEVGEKLMNFIQPERSKREDPK